MKQDAGRTAPDETPRAADLDTLVRRRIRGLRLARGWSLDDLAARCYLSPSTLSRLETGHRRIALDQLTAIARALGASLDQLVESVDDEDVVIRPHRDTVGGVTTWMLNRDGGPQGVRVAKMRLTKSVSDRLDAPGDLRVHPGRDWFTVLAGTVELRLGERAILVTAGEAAEFSTMTPHAIGAHGGPAEILCIFDQDGHRTHLAPSRHDARHEAPHEARHDARHEAPHEALRDARHDARHDPPETPLR